MVYIELLNALFEEGGQLAADPAQLENVLGVPSEEIARCLPVLEELGRGRRGGIVIKDGRVNNRRVSEELNEEEVYRAEQSRLGKLGGRPKHKGKPSESEGYPSFEKGYLKPASASAPAPAGASNGTVQEHHQRAPTRTAADDVRLGTERPGNDYEAEVLSLYTSLPGTRDSASRKDRKTAAAFQQQGLPLAAVRAGMFLAVARRVLRTDPVCEPIGSLAYFEPAIAEAQLPPPEAGLDWETQRDAYTGHLEARIREWMAGDDIANKLQAQAATAEEGNKPP